METLAVRDHSPARALTFSHKGDFFLFQYYFDTSIESALENPDVPGDSNAVLCPGGNGVRRKQR